MAAGIPVLRIIRNFIPMVAILFQNFPRSGIHPAFVLFRRKRQHFFRAQRLVCVLTIPVPERRTFFDDQAVGRQMLRCKLCSFHECLLPALHRLSRQRGHQIDVDVFKPSSPRLLIVLDKGIKIVNSAKHGKLFVTRRLQPHAQPVDSGTPISGEFFKIQRARVAFQRNFCIVRNAKMRPDRVHQPFHIHDAQKGRRTAAPENRSDSALLIKLTLLHDLRDKGVDVGLRDVRIRSRSALLSAPGIPDNLSPRIHAAHVCVTRRAHCQRCRQEIAVATFLPAERNVQI